MGKKYRYHDGRVLEVCAGLGEAPCYFTGVRKERSIKRFKSARLLPRAGAQEAQQDLDDEARRKGWPEVR